eukprot:TRINITY_DN18531_c1_g1_i3.p1 TRINITY_DN18531_c1_g1~~TRINITY_DN18531_c1_g1_i3.p1  ORF type:complete len:373 (-),score=78.80 TRINITY_DN18531_c1_g1_i3:202-1320(-)
MAEGGDAPFEEQGEEAASVSNELAQCMRQVAATYRQRDYDALGLALLAVQDALRGSGANAEPRGSRAQRAQVLDRLLERELLGGGGMAAWLAPLLMKPAGNVADVAEALMEDLKDARREEVLHCHYRGETPLQIAVANPEEWTMADGRAVWHGTRSFMKLLNSDGDHGVDVRGRRVLELGCGLGVVGLTCVRDCEATAVVLTDYDESLLETCERSIELNELRDVASVARLDWNDIVAGRPLEPELANFDFDIILGADIIYEDSHSILLTQTLAHLLARASSSGTRAAAVEAVLVCGGPEIREGIRALDALLGVREGHFVEFGHDSGDVKIKSDMSAAGEDAEATGCITLHWSLQRLPALEKGRTQRMYRFHC